MLEPKSAFAILQKKDWRVRHNGSVSRYTRIRNYVDALPKSSNLCKGGICETLLQSIALRDVHFRERQQRHHAERAELRIKSTPYLNHRIFDDGVGNRTSASFGDTIGIRIR